jgi:DNA-binding NarL/FixJ family response regulator
MQAVNIVLLSNKSKVADAIIDLLPENCKVQHLLFSASQLLKDIKLETDIFKIPDVFILNLSESSDNGELLISNLRVAHADVPIIVLHLYHQKKFAEAFIKMGADAYLSVNFSTEDLFNAINETISKRTLGGKNNSSHQ